MGVLLVKWVYQYRSTYVLNIFSTHTDASLHNEWMPLKNLSTAFIFKENKNFMNQLLSI